MRKILLCCAAITMLVLSGCGFFPIIEGSGVLVEGSADFTDFSSLNIDDAFVVRIVPGAEYAVTITCDDNVIDYVEMKKEDGIVSVGMEPFNAYINVTLSAEVTMPEFTALELSGASSAMVMAGFDSVNALSLVISGASTVEIANITAGALTADVSGASTVTGSMYSSSTEMNVSGASEVELRGDTGAASLDVSGASDIDWELFEAMSLNAVFSGASDGTVYVNGGTLEVDITGASTLRYRGTPGGLVIHEISGSSSFYQL